MLQNPWKYLLAFKQYLLACSNALKIMNNIHKTSLQNPTSPPRCVNRAEMSITRFDL